MSSQPLPIREGFYWAKWRIANDDTREAEELTPSDSWEVVYVFENSFDLASDERFMASVPGVEKSQSVENFYWGPGPLTEPGKAAS